MDNDNYDFVLDRDNCTELDSGVLYDNKSDDTTSSIVGGEQIYYHMKLILSGLNSLKKLLFLGSTSSEESFHTSYQ